MTMKELTLNAFGVYKKNFWKLFLPLVALQLAILVPLMVLTMPGMANTTKAVVGAVTGSMSLGITGNVAGMVLIYVLLMLLFVSPLVVSNTVFVVDKDRQNQEVSFRESARYSRKNYGHMLKTYLAAVVCALPVFLFVGLVLWRVYAHLVAGVLTVLELVLVIAAAVALLLYVLGTVFVPYVVVSEKRKGFDALFASFKYLYSGKFLNTVGRLAFAGIAVALLSLLINYLAKLPFDELFQLYLVDPIAALQEPLMLFAIIFSIGAIFLVAFIFPFWYAFSYHTYLIARQEYEEKQTQKEIEQ